MVAMETRGNPQCLYIQTFPLGYILKTGPVARFYHEKAQFFYQSVAINVYRDYIFVIKRLNYVLSIENISYVISVLLNGGIFKVNLQSRLSP